MRIIMADHRFLMLISIYFFCHMRVVFCESSGEASIVSTHPVNTSSTEASTTPATTNTITSEAASSFGTLTTEHATRTSSEEQSSFTGTILTGATTSTGPTAPTAELTIPSTSTNSITSSGEQTDSTTVSPTETTFISTTAALSCNISWATPAEEAVLLFTCSCNKFNDSNICVTTQLDYRACLPFKTTELNTTCSVLFDETPGMTYSANASNGTWIYKTLKPLPVSNLTAHGLTVSWKNPESKIFNSIVLCANGTNGSCDNITNNTAESYTFTNLVPGASYTITAQVFSNGVGSEICNTSHTLKPLPVSNLIANGSTVSWENPESVSTVFDRIELCAKGANGSCDNITNNSTNSYTFTNLVPGASYIITAQVFSNGVGSDTINTNHTLRPSTPQNVIATRQNRSVTVSWTYPSSDVKDYFEIKCDPPIALCIGLAVKVENSQHVIPDILYGQLYKFFVRALSKDLYSEWVPSNHIFSNPGAPTGLRAGITSSSKTSVELSWTVPEVTHLADYSVHVCAKRQQSCQNFNTMNVTTYTVNGLVNGETYNFTVKSQTENGTLSEDSNNKSLTIEPLPANELRLLIVTSNAMGWIWRNGTGFYDGWNLFLNGANETAENQETLSKNYTGLNPDTSYTFSVRSYVGGAGDKIFSEWRNVTNKTDEADPDPANISSLTSTNDSITIQWSEPDHPRGVILYYVVTLLESSFSNCSNMTVVNCKDRQGREGTDYQQKINRASTGCPRYSNVTTSCDLLMNHSFQNLKPHTNYTVQIRAVNSKEPSVVNQTIATNESAPQNSPKWDQNMTIVSSFWVFLSWEKVDDKQGTIIRYEIRNNGAKTHINTTTTYHNLTELSPYRLYSLAVKACTSVACGSFSDALDVRTKQSNPSGHPNNLSIMSYGSSYVELSWNEINENETNGVIRGYKIEYYSPLSAVSVNNSISTTLNVTGLSPYTMYKFNVSGYCISETGEKLYGLSEAFINQKTGVGKPNTMLNETIKEELKKSVVTETKTITFKMPPITHVFSTAAGPIIHYQVLVVSGNNREENKVPKTWSESKKQKFQEPYAPFLQEDVNVSTRRKRASEQETITLGKIDCDPDKNVTCNGPLEPGIMYCVYLRGWTEAGHTDADCLITEATKPDNTPAIVGGVVAAIVLIAFIVVIIVMKRRKTGCFKKGAESDSRGLSHAMEPMRPNTPPPQAVALREFIEHVINMHRDQDFRFSQEYQRIKEMSPKHGHSHAVLSCNTSKNRWVDILPFDHSRVKLLPADEEEGSDYINANYLPGYNSRREYIATQGPLPGTIDHYWRMVWEQNVTMIVMLTQCIERGKRKCEQYWPESVEEATTYGDLVVTKRAESVLPEYTIRIFDIQLGELTRSVKQFFVSFWPDFGCPDNTESLLNLVRVVRSHMRPDSAGPLLVHCSAGVGRTGTYVAVDRLLQHIQDHDDINIFNLVLEMREYRCRMVQTEDQYIYIHDCIKEALEKGMSRRYKPTSSPTKFNDEEPIYENTNAAAEVDAVQINIK